MSATAGDWMLWWTRDHHIEARNIAVPGVPPIRRPLPFPVNGRVYLAHMSDDHTLIATVDALGHVTLWDARSHRELHSFPERGPAGYNTLYLLDFSADSRRLAVVNPRREVRLYDTATAQEITAIAMPDIVGVGFSPDDQWLVLGTVNQLHFQFHYLPSAPLD